jgi:hypothetical protein
MAQRKSPSGGKPAAKKGTTRPAGKPGVSSSANLGAGPRKAPPRKPGKSIVNQKQTPWGVIISIAAVVLFAGAVVGVVIATKKSNDSGTGASCGGANAPYCQPELPAAKQIRGVTYKVVKNHEHVTSTVHYSTTPPTGGNHSQYWADCDGTVYPNAIANENAVHDLEHGAVWVTYREGLPSSEVDTLASDVTGQQKVLMSPYPDLKSKVSLQAWGYQLFVNNVNDPRITQFIGALAGNSKITPENASCSQPTFKEHPSTFGHPLFAPVSGTAASMSGSATP